MRNDFILKHIRKDEPGLEIGPSHNPIAPKSQGFNVEIIDHASKEGLREKYKTHNVNLDNIEDVDYIWKGGSYCELTKKESHYKWIIASHLIEHTPDFIGFLKNCQEVLADDGVLILVVPDKRFCFDYFRPVTGVSKIIDAHLNGNTIHTAGTAAEYFLNVTKRGDVIAWDQANKTSLFQLVHSLGEAKNAMNSIINDKVFLDLHSWVFTPSSFRLIIHDLNSLDLISLKELEFSPTVGCEFFVSLSATSINELVNREVLLTEYHNECCDMYADRSGISIKGRA